MSLIVTAFASIADVRGTRTPELAREDSALIQLDQLDQKSRILELGFERIDLRDPEMVAVRPRDPSRVSAGPAGV